MQLKELIEKKKLAERQINDILNNLQKETDTKVVVDIKQLFSWDVGNYLVTTINLTL